MNLFPVCAWVEFRFCESFAGWDNERILNILFLQFSLFNANDTKEEDAGQFQKLKIDQ